MTQNSASRVSIITATYNRGDVLRCAIESVRRQTVTDWEHIIVGDACTDDTAEVVASLADPRMRFVNRETNYGEQSVPNNDGFALSTGRLIAYLNHDDLWFPDHLETLMAYMDETGADLVYALPFSVDRNGLTYCGTTNSVLRYDPSHFIVSSLWLARRELIEEMGGWRPALEIHAVSPSQDLLARAWQHGKELRCCPRVTALFLPSGGRPSSHNERDSSQHEALLADMLRPGMREELLTRHAMSTARAIDEMEIRQGGVKARLNRAFDGAVKALHLRPDAVRNRLARRRKGWWVDHIRGVRGLGPLDRKPPQ
jgi:glycosyltransferase involved in cell wall biosynthesis